MQLGNKSTKNQQKKNVAFLYRIYVKLIRNTVHQLKQLRDSVIPRKTVSETFHYPGYVIRLQLERQKQAKKSKFSKKRCLSQLNIKLFTKAVNNF